MKQLLWPGLSLSVFLLCLLLYPCRTLLGLAGLTLRPWAVTCTLVLAWLSGLSGLLSGCWLLMTRGFLPRRGTLWRELLCKTCSAAAALAAMLLGIFLSLWMLLAVAFSAMPEHLVRQDGQIYVACVNSFLDTSVSLHRMHGAFLMATEGTVIYFADGGFDPFDDPEAAGLSYHYSDTARCWVPD